MINNEEFTKRLKKVIDFYGESASSFAEKIGVQRSSISHILSGRNKPSLEFVLKVLSSFPEVELYWLMNGKGNFPSGKNSEPQIEKKSTVQNQNLFSSSENENAQKEITVEKIISSNSKKEIERIIIFYKDGSFSNFEN
ncbi:helix-turn-helix protein [Lacinutrix venerupis]|uniref:Transcriptional regulator n=1 Tax=Lacinutrix venerupis TaxID=1486034 RepID=A0AAC9PWR6_9FLAO|nr:helix-turn-helix transcriptional regulator [Lacinutrix venerupis]APY00356.1 transcriptional regulator [Lacinutrix venerupis]RLJ68817.1 helix-turn-helix protein [Lacinutrix venerupis]